MSANNHSENEIANKLLIAVHALKGAKIMSITPLAGDASARSFFRIFLENSEIPTVILMLAPAQMGPPVGGLTSVAQNQAYAEVSHLLAMNKIPVLAGRHHHLDTMFCQPGRIKAILHGVTRS